MAKEYTYKFDEFSKQITEGIEPRFKFSEIDKIISEYEDDIEPVIDNGVDSDSDTISIDDLDTDTSTEPNTEDISTDTDTDVDMDDTDTQSDFDADMSDLEQEVADNNITEEPIDMGGREDMTIDTLNQYMGNINDYLKILNKNIKLEDVSKISPKMIEQIDQISTILFGEKKKEETSSESLSKSMKNINSYISILNDNLRSENPGDMTPKMIEQIEEINTILY